MVGPQPAYRRAPQDTASGNIESCDITKVAAGHIEHPAVTGQVRILGKVEPAAAFQVSLGQPLQGVAKQAHTFAIGHHVQGIHHLVAAEIQQGDSAVHHVGDKGNFSRSATQLGRRILRAAPVTHFTPGQVCGKHHSCQQHPGKQVPDLTHLADQR